MEKIKLARTFLFKCFIIAFLFNVLNALFLVFGVMDWGAGLALSWYGIPKDLFMELTVYMMTLIKVGAIMLFLVPALALHWMLCCKKCGLKEE